MQQRHKKRLRSNLLAGLALLIAVFSVQAAEQVQGLYDVQQPVASQSERDRIKATVQGLKLVLVRISGNHSVLGNDSIKSSLQRAESFLKQFSYKELAADESNSSQLLINMTFEPSLVEQLLRAEGLPIWSNNRPTVLVWLVADGREGRRFVGQSEQRLVASIERQARRRGLAVKLPSLDLEDSIAISPNEMWKLNRWSAQRAAERYNADSLLIGRMTELSNGQWLGDWLFANDESPNRLESQAPELDEYVGQGMDMVADQLAEKYAVVPKAMSAEGLIMRLTGIDNFVDYARAVNYLQQLSAVHYANPIHIDADQLLVHLIADGQLQQLEQALALGKKLVKIAPMDALQTLSLPTIQLNYHWPVRD